MKYRDLVKLVERAGWQHVRTTGSHMIFNHPARQAIVTVPGGGKLNRDVPPGTLRDILRDAGIK